MTAGMWLHGHRMFIFKSSRSTVAVSVRASSPELSGCVITRLGQDAQNSVEPASHFDSKKTACTIQYLTPFGRVAFIGQLLSLKKYWRTDRPLEDFSPPCSLIPPRIERIERKQTQ
jgi:hypothetical protein